MVTVISINKITCNCPKCNSTLEALKSDFITKQAGRQEYKDFITCPVCQNDIESCYWKEAKNESR